MNRIIDENKITKIIRSAKIDLPASSDTFKESLKVEVLNEYAASSNPSKLLGIGRLLKFSLSILILVMFIPFVAYIKDNLVNSSDNANNIPTVATVSFSEGLFEKQSLNDDIWVPIEERSPIRVGDVLRINGEGRSTIELTDGTSLRMRSNTTITLEEVNDDSVVIVNDSGYLFSRVVESERQFKVMVDDIEIKSLGTAYLTVNVAAQKGVEVFQSSVEISTADSEDILELNEGQKLYVNENNGSLISDNKEIEEIEIQEVKSNEFILWNKELDENNEKFRPYLGILEDLTPPDMQFVSPKNGQLVFADSILLEGIIEPGATLTVEGQRVNVSNGLVSHSVNLELGNNIIYIEAEDSVGNISTKSIYVNRVDEEGSESPYANSIIELSIDKNDDGLDLAWETNNIDTEFGFMVLVSDKPDQQYLDNEVEQLEGEIRSTSLGIKDGRPHYIRICQYLGDGTCGVYSDSVRITATSIMGETNLDSIILESTEDNNVKWNIVGESDRMFALIWSKNDLPVNYQMESSKIFEIGKLSSFEITGDPGGEYNVVVCELIDDKCAVYSNQIAIKLED